LQITPRNRTSWLSIPLLFVISTRLGTPGGALPPRSHFRLYSFLLPGNWIKIHIMNIYKTVQQKVKKEAGFVPKTCWIAHVLELNGQQPRTARNRKDQGTRQFPCPPDKRTPIELALRELKQI
jgi:hypothetical protein